MDASELMIFAGTLALVTATPGPSIAALVARVLSGGFRSVLPFLLAMWIGEVVWLSGAIFGLSFLAERFQWAFMAITYCGIAYLLYLAYRMWMSIGIPEEDELPIAKSSWQLFMAGMAVTLGNPKVMVLYLALLPAVVNLSNVSLSEWLVLAIVTFIVCAAVDSGWAMLADRARRWLKSPTAMLAANRTSAVVMALAAVAIAIT